jgi:choloylglycine hydrolase
MRRSMRAHRSTTPAPVAMLRTLLAASIAGATVLSVDTAAACTSILLKAQNGDLVYGRTLEFALKLDSNLLVVPRNYKTQCTGPDGKVGSGTTYTTKYAAAGANALDLPVIVDGINEKGLAAGMFFFPTLAEFQQVDPAQASNSLASHEIVSYILTQFATVEEVKAGLAKIKVNRGPLAVFNGPAPIHVSVHDASGNTIAIEYIGGELQITDNPTGVMTNAPAIAWHLGSLSQYANASPEPAPPFTINGKSFPAWSTGNGCNGLPGDFSSPSRFIRAAFLASSAPKFEDASEGLGIVSHIMNQFDIPPGAIRTLAGGSAGGGVAGYETTEWTSTADLKNGIYRISTYENPSIRQISMKQLDLDAKDIRVIKLDQPPVVTDLSKK